MNTALLSRFETALAADKLDTLVNEMAAEGASQVEILYRFDQFRALLRKTGRETEEDKVMDTMDRIDGWCSSHNKLFPHYLTNEEIEAYRMQIEGSDDAT